MKDLLASPAAVRGGEIFERGAVTARHAPRGRPPGESRSAPCTQ